MTMTVYVALLRAVNVGGTGMIPMDDLKALCGCLGFEDVRTYIQSGNVVFRSERDAASTQALLARSLAARMKGPVGVILRTPSELRRTLAGNPFPKAPTNRVIVFFLDARPEKGAIDGLRIPGNEEVRVVGREIFVYYPDGQGRSRLRLPQAKTATGRNLNTVAALAELAESTSRAPRSPRPSGRDRASSSARSAPDTRNRAGRRSRSPG
jgi:uncharacterized protein (DUF1697 family)